jgi:radical SAM superfamily enzyme YgiQ (UPF0313 family)
MGKLTTRQHAAWRAGEIGARPAESGWARAAVVYPGPYRVAMANLGYQWLIQALGRAGLAVTRVLWPEKALWAEAEKDGLVGLDDDRPAGAADVWFVSISYENDLANLAGLLRLANLEPQAKARGDDAPLIVAGGIVPTLNPEPISELVDVCLLGEGGDALGPFVDYLKQNDPRRRATFLAGLKDVPHAYVGRFYQSRYDGHRLAALEPTEGFPARITAAREKTIDPDAYRIHLRAPGAVFGDSLLTEAARGCVTRCRFCAAGHVLLPYRTAGPPATLPDLGQSVLGLVGSNVSGHPNLGDWLDAAGEHRVALSSIRRATLDESAWRRLVESGLNSAAIAPEAGSERLRRVINKPATDDEIVAEMRAATAAGVKNLKLYFMVGLPTETDEDLAAIVELTRRCREAAMTGWKERGWAGRITLSVNPFVPKPQTPFQWWPFGREKDIKRRLAVVAGAQKQLANVQVQKSAVGHAMVQALLAVGDRRAGELAILADGAPSVRAALRAMTLPAADALTYRRAVEELLPWDHIEVGVSRRYLENEFAAAQAERTSPPCRVESGCRICGACS